MFERLTKKDTYGHYYTNVPIHDRGLSCDGNGNWAKSPDISAWDGSAIDRLAEYENSRLSPEQAKEIASVMDTFRSLNIIRYTLVFLFNSTKDKLIMVHKNRGPYPNKYNGVGGKVEYGEFTKDCAYREVKEETGITKDQIDRFHQYNCLMISNAELNVFYGVLKPGVTFTQVEDEPLYWVDTSIVINTSPAQDIGYAGDGNVPYLVNLALIMDRCEYGN